MESPDSSNDSYLLDDEALQALDDFELNRATAMYMAQIVGEFNESLVEGDMEQLDVMDAVDADQQDTRALAEYVYKSASYIHLHLTA